MTDNGKKKNGFKSKVSDFSDAVSFSVPYSGTGYAGYHAKKSGIGRIGRFTNAVGKMLAYTSAMAYGLFFLTFGLLTLFSHLIRYYFERTAELSPMPLIIAAAVSLASLPFLRIDKPLAVVIQDVRLIDFILFEFFSISRMHKGRKEKSIPPIVMALLGIIPAAFAYFFTPSYALIGIGVIVLAVLAFASPEFSLIFTLLFLPLVYLIPNGEIMLAALAVLTFVSFVRKVILGKRVYNFEIYDIFILGIIIFLVVSAFVFGSGEMKINIIFSLILLFYFTASNLLVNRRLADCAVNAIIVSAIPVSVIAIIEYLIETHIIPVTSSGILQQSNGVSAAFTSPDSLSAFLLVSLAFTVGYAADSKRLWVILSYLALIILQITALVLSSSTWAIAVAAVSAIAYFVIKSKRIPTDALLITALLLHFLLMLSPELLNSAVIFEGEAPALLVAEFARAFELFGADILLGIGFSSSAPRHNLFLGIGLKTGIFVLFLFACMIFIRYRHASHYRRYVKNSAVDVISNSSALAITALLMFGVFYPVIEDVAMYTLFFVVFAIGSSSLRSAKKEYDDRMGYYSDSRSADASSLDIEIGKK